MTLKNRLKERRANTPCHIIVKDKYRVYFSLKKIIQRLSRSKFLLQIHDSMSLKNHLVSLLLYSKPNKKKKGENNI